MQAQLDQLMAMVTLIQRQAAPFGYVPGAIHAGLTGTGVIAIQGLIGCKSVTTLPTQLRDLRLARRTFRPRVSDVRHARRLPNVDPN